MKRPLLLALATSLALPTAASAAITEMGAVPEGVKGSCPANCQAVSRTTGYQAKVGPDRAAYRAPANGRIAAWTIALGNPGPKQAQFFTQRLGGASQAAIVVMTPGKKLTQSVTAKSPLETLTPYFGQVVQFPLEQTLKVRKGQFIGLSVPTWAPALQIGLGSDTSWRSSRATSKCSDTSTQSALLGNRKNASFRCLYRTARLTFSATFISDPAGAAPKATPAPTTTTPKTQTTPKNG